jgi:hypothetical protein
MISFALLLAGCGSSGPSKEVRAWAFVFNGQDTQAFSAQTKAFEHGHALVLFAAIPAAQGKDIGRLLKGAQISFDGRGATEGARTIAHDAQAAYIKAVLLDDNLPEWFRLPPSSSISAIYERRSSNATVRYIVVDDQTVWIYGVGERWQ